MAARYLSAFQADEGVLFIGKAQEKAPVFRTERRRNPKTGATYPWLVRSTAMVNQFYVYAVDRDFGPFFLKFCSYFPYNAKLCINGHEWLKRQLALSGTSILRRSITASSPAQAPQRAQALCERLSAEKIDALLRKWLRRLPTPLALPIARGLSLRSLDPASGVLAHPGAGPSGTGRAFFEEVIRENLDIGRPSQAQLIFERGVNRRTPRRFRTRVITEG